MKKTLLIFAALLSASAFAEVTDVPSIDPKMTILYPEDKSGAATDYNGDAPMTARFEANADCAGYDPHYEWTIKKQGETKAIITRPDADIEYTFTEFGTFEVNLVVMFSKGADEVELQMDKPFVVSINDSNLELPNAFSPNGDGQNDIFKVKNTTRSLVEFKACVYNRWGRLLYTWTDWKNGGWDGTVGGNGGAKCPDGAYFLHVVAKGADGRKYNKRITINILTGYHLENGEE